VKGRSLHLETRAIHFSAVSLGGLKACLTSQSGKVQGQQRTASIAMRQYTAIENNEIETNTTRPSHPPRADDHFQNVTTGPTEASSGGKIPPGFFPSPPSSSLTHPSPPDR
jgi:hypothetical protein